MFPKVARKVATAVFTQTMCLSNKPWRPTNIWATFGKKIVTQSGHTATDLWSRKWPLYQLSHNHGFVYLFFWFSVTQNERRTNLNKIFCLFVFVTKVAFRSTEFDIKTFNKLQYVKSQAFVCEQTTCFIKYWAREREREIHSGSFVSCVVLSR